jgi:peptidoglycan hydrolase-like protein with peptidoglycan-binding domain
MAGRTRSPRWRWPNAVAAAALTIAVGACADSRDASPDDTIPRITADSSVTTTVPPTTPAPPTTTAPATTAAPQPLPTQATLPPTLPPVAPTQQQTAPPTQPRITEPPGPTSTVVVTPGEPPNCSSDGIGADTGHLVIEDVTCRAGWAIGRIDPCPPGENCTDVDVFHVTADGWTHDGSFSIACPESLTESGMSIYTALAFNPSPCEGDAGPAEIIRPDSTGQRVTQLQIALVALGYDIIPDGRYGPRTQAAVRDFQARNSLEVDGISGPRTQAALGIGPGADPAPTAPPAAPTTTAPSSTAVVTAGEPVECTAAAISADLGRAVDEITACRGGWALGAESCAAAGVDCRADVFHVTDEGWVHDGAFPADCVDDLTVTGMAVHTAAEFAELCADGLPERENVLPGSTGPEVEQVQIALVAVGYPIAVDGTYGPRTEAAVRDFQTANDLEIDGIAGPDTQTALGL